MSLRLLAHNRLSTFTVRVLLVSFLLFGGAIVPVRIADQSPTGVAGQVTLTGPDADAYLERRSGRDAQFRAGLMKSLAKARSPETSKANRIVTLMPTLMPRSAETRQFTLLSWIANRWAAHADPLYTYDGDAVHVLTEGASDATALWVEYNSYFYDGGTGVAVSEDVKVWLNEDPDLIHVEVTNGSMGCFEPKSIGASPWDFFSPVINAQHTHDGVNCHDTPAMNNHFGAKHAQAIRDIIRELAWPEAVFCLIFGPGGWFTCMGLALSAEYMGFMGWEAIDTIWDCRCHFMGVDCGGGELLPI